MSSERVPATASEPAVSTAGGSSAESNARTLRMTEEQAARLKSLCAEVGQTFDSKLSKIEAAKRIESLERQIDCAQPPIDGGDGGTSIRANEALPEDQPSSR